MRDNATALADLAMMLTYCRPHGSKSERKFINRYIRSLPGIQVDDFGNLFKEIGDNNRVAWCCHTDSVHRRPGRQEIASGPDNTMRLPKDSRSNCLGADDAAGVWIMREMILAGVPGLYIFHRAEEVGGQGSSHIASKTPAYLEGIDIAISFDRRGKRDVITHQFGMRSASDAFARSLAEQLNTADPTFSYRPSPDGIFTDTANYTDLVAECTNISVGYDGEHSTRETLDYDHLVRLRDALLLLDTDRLVVSRVPGSVEPSRRSSRSCSGFFAPEDFEWDGYPGWDRDEVPRRYADLWSDNDDHSGAFSPLDTARNQTLFSLVREYPDEVADILEEFGYDAKNLADEVMQRRCQVGTRRLS